MDKLRGTEINVDFSQDLFIPESRKNVPFKYTLDLTEWIVLILLSLEAFSVFWRESRHW